MNQSRARNKHPIPAGYARAAALCLALVAVPARASWSGIPTNDGFPSWQERTLLVLVNRDRADPQTSLASCTAANCPDKVCYGAVPPVGWDYDLNRSSRFHSLNLTASHSPLQHPSPCLLQSNIGQTFPSSCDGSPACACTGAVKCDCGSNPVCSCDSTSSACVTQPFERIHAFSPNGCAENIAAGYSDPVAVEQGFLLETCSCCTNTCPPQSTFCPNNNGEVNGHRLSILNGSNAILGTGEAPNGAHGCFQGHWYTQDYGCGVAGPTKLVAGTHYPQSGTSFTFWANWFDVADAAVASVVIDGVAQPMTRERGTVTGNETYSVQQTLSAGCHTYVFSFQDTARTTYTMPTAGTYLAGDSCTSDYTNGGSTGGTTGGGSGGTTGGGTGTGGIGVDAGLGIVVSSGCACTTTARSTTSSDLLLLIAAVALARRRR